MNIFQNLQINHREKAQVKLNQHKNKGTESNLNIFEVAKLMDDLFIDDKSSNMNIHTFQIVLN